ncbi:alginate export family protein [Draconibacterium sp.]
MKSLKYLSLVVIGLFIANVAAAQFSLTGEFRPRTEFNHGYKALAYEDQDWSIPTTQRSRLNAMFNNEIVKTKLTLQDVRYWGGQAQLVNNEDYAVSVHEAWADVELAKNFSIKAGRQELVYDDHRIFGNVAWTQQARSHDVALFKYEKDFKLHFGIAHHENSNITNNIYDGPDAYKDMQYLWFNKTWKKNSLSLLLLNNGVPVMENEKQVSKYSQTMGGHFNTGFEKASLAANFYYQTGKNTSGKDINAINFLMEASLKSGFSAGYEYLSGNSYDKYDKVYAFNPMYGTNHKFNGFMDYFYVGSYNNSYGLNDVYLKYKYSKKKIGLNADLHYFATAGKINAEASNSLGTEMDLTFSYKIHDMAALSAGWSTMFATESMELIKGGDKNAGNHWAYIMLSVTPTFIK